MTKKKIDPIEYRLLNSKGKVETIAPLQMAMRYLKNSLPDGDYSLTGPHTDLILERREGVIYPTGGRLKGQTIDPRQLDEAKTFFEAK